MTREEAKDLLLNISAYDIDMQRGMAKKEAIEMAIEALEQEPCEDCISRQAAIGIIQNWLGSDTGYSWGEKNVMLCTIDELRGLPSVSTEKTGRWINHSYYKDAYICSACNTGGNMVYKDFKYCPNCGAKMEAEE